MTVLVTGAAGFIGRHLTVSFEQVLGIFDTKPYNLFLRLFAIRGIGTIGQINGALVGQHFGDLLPNGGTSHPRIKNAYWIFHA